MDKKEIVPYAELKTGTCDDGRPHRVWLSLTGDAHPAFCSKCSKVSNDVPPEVYNDI